VVIDLSDDPSLGVRFAQFLAEHSRGQRLIAAGPTLEPELVLGIMRAGAVDYLLKPVSTEQLSAAVRRVEQLMGKPEKQSAREPGRLFTFFSAKGGSGATTVATNAAITVHQLTGKKTLLVDLDLQLGEVALTLGVEPRFNFVDLIKNFHRMDANLLASYIEQHESGVNVLSAPFQPEQTEEVSGEDIRRVLHFLRQHFDYVIVDTSKSFSPGTIAAFDQSDAVYIVSVVDLPSLRNIQRALPLLRRVLRRGNDQIRLVVNRYQPDDLISPEEVERTLGLKVYWKLRNDYTAVMGSLNSGKPIVLNGTSAYSQDVRALAADLAGMPAGSGKQGGLKGLFGKLRNRSKEGR
jgi:pilus assembly protein CpaE